MKPKTLSKIKEINKMKKVCDYCGEPLGEIYFTNAKTKKSYHFNFQGKDCLAEFMNKNL